MLKIGITGGIGSGKSTVSHIFQTLGIPVFDADNAAKNIMQQNITVRKKLIAAFGKNAFTNGQLNRSYIANIVFNNEKKLNTLNSIVHPATINAAHEWMNQQNSPYAIKEAALLFEANSITDLDAIIGVCAPLDLRISRIMKRNNLSKKEIETRINKQMNEEKKMSLCDYVLHNDEKELLTPQVLSLHRKFLDS